MIRHLAFLTACIWMGLASLSALSAQEMTATARVDADQSRIKDRWFGKTDIELHLSQGVPFRVFTLANPPRLVLDFRTVDWSGLRAADLLAGTDALSNLRFGNFQPGWSRLVADLEGPMLPDEVTMRLNEATGRAVLSITMAATEPDAFQARAGAPQDALWPQPQPQQVPAPLVDDRFVVAIDPGHGGVDPGAERENVNEKELMLMLAFELREALLRSGVSDVVLTREADVFVSLEGRVAIAHRAGADVFISLHADALSEGGAQGATVYVLSEAASDKATAHLAARHSRADIIAGTDLTGSDDEVASVLLDLARQETEPRSEALAAALVKGMTQAGGPMNRRPLRNAGFSVLKSADIPSVLVEVGFLSSARDLANLRDPTWRARMTGGMVHAIMTWRDGDAAKRPLVRQ
ncbi:N-acetylmuramoyl-L-alanine amidase AmiC [Roseobacter fucihabitans]|uniref:N-acetylmuramoyl-L-alanine amidase n=1 Tax=Roseobacter fucihabitans TaxID=1537242 RepID=A0ABZ2BT84_9RHOB|nr:N-acetylmuramoyl-L-alanine amidase [Roseobacter litoralis]MBC6967466.1 N-acetylmuramoyl-L-alanine amidase AmiC precursor [Roseobacter litoralis]